MLQYIFLLRKFSKSSKPQILRVFIPSQLILFQIINGQDWVYGSFEVTEKDFQLIREHNSPVKKILSNDHIVNAGQQFKMILTARKRDYLEIFKEVPYLYLLIT